MVASGPSAAMISRGSIGGQVLERIDHPKQEPGERRIRAGEELACALVGELTLGGAFLELGDQKRNVGIGAEVLHPA